MNKVILTGRITKEIELKYTQSGTAVATFTMAVDRRFKNAAGEKETDFINCVAWRKTAELAANYLSKGSKVGVVGAWNTRNFEAQDGRRVYVNECVIDELEFLDSKGGGGGGSNASYQQDEPPVDISDDDLPF